MNHQLLKRSRDYIGRSAKAPMHAIGFNAGEYPLIGWSDEQRPPRLCSVL